MIKATPFHARAADHNRANAWTRRAGFTVSEFYSGVEEEALTARSAAVIADISYRARLNISGTRSEEFLLRLVTRNVAQQDVGVGVPALWLDENGVPQGGGVIARLGREQFLIQTQSDTAWIEQAAALFGIAPVRQDAGLVLIGPSVRPTLLAAGLSMPAPTRIEGAAWRGLDVVLSHFGAGVEIWCKKDDAELVWDRVLRAGVPFGLMPAGLAALDVLDMETLLPLAAGIEANHTGFSGQDAYIADLAQESSCMIGVDIDSETPVQYAPLMRQGRMSGQIKLSLYSPALGRVIALASVDARDAPPGTEFTITLPPDTRHPSPRIVEARAVRLPFLPL